MRLKASGSTPDTALSVSRVHKGDTGTRALANVERRSWKGVPVTISLRSRPVSSMDQSTKAQQILSVASFAGNEIVAVYRIRVDRQIGSAARVADGIHARTDGFTSLAVVLGAVGVMLGFPLADPIVGLVISLAIFILMIGTVRSVGRRLMDGIEPELVDKAEVALASTPGVLSVSDLRLRWVATACKERQASGSPTASCPRCRKSHAKRSTASTTPCRISTSSRSDSQRTSAS